MAKLPDDTALGQIGFGTSGRPIATIDTSGYARGAAAMAKGAQDLGEGFMKAGAAVGAVAAADSALDEKMQVARATSDLTVNKVELDSSLSNETEYKDIPSNYDKNINGVFENAAKHITNPKTRELWKSTHAATVVRGSFAAGVKANALWKDATLAETNRTIEVERLAALKSSDPEDIKNLVDSTNFKINWLAERGIIGKNDAVTKQRDWSQKFVIDKLETLTPDERVDAVSSSKERLMHRESGGRPGLMNQLGYSGLFQFGAPRLETLGVYKPGEGENLSGWSKTGKNAPGKWSGTFNIPGFPEVRTIKDFLASPAAQHAAYNIDGKKMDQEIEKLGLEKYIGTEVRGAPLTRDGLKAMMHLGGAGGAASALSGGRNNTDANGTSVLDYAHIGAQTGNRRLASMLPEDTRVKIRNGAQVEVDTAVLKQSAIQTETIESKIIAARDGLAPLLPREEIIAANLAPAHENALLDKWRVVAARDDAYQFGAQKLSTPDAIWNPSDEADKKALSAVDVKTGLVRELQAGSGEAQAVAAHRFAEIGMVSPEVKGTLEGMIRGGNDKQLQYAMSTLDGMERKNPKAFAVAFSDDTNKVLGLWRSKANEAPGAFPEALRRSNDPATAKARESAKVEASKIVSEMTDKELMASFDKSWFSSPGKPMGTRDAPGMSVFREEYRAVFAEVYAAMDGDKDAARKYADKRMTANGWGVSAAANGILMKHAPETMPFFPSVTDDAGGKDWMRKQVRAAVIEAMGIKPEELGNKKDMLLSGKGKRPAKQSDYDNIDLVYGLTALPGTEAEIQHLKAGGKLPDGRESPGWVLGWFDPATGSPKQRIFHFDLVGPREDRKKFLEQKQQQRLGIQADKPFLDSTVLGGP